jgi:hypothetical protein
LCGTDRDRLRIDSWPNPGVFLEGQALSHDSAGNPVGMSGCGTVSAEVEVDGSRSDPIPHILKGIPLKVRDIRVFADKPNFTLNPTSCEEMATRAQIFGSFLDVFNPADDQAIAKSARFPGFLLRFSRLLTEARLRPQRWDQTRRAPGAHRHLHAQGRRRQPGEPDRTPAALGLPRPRPHQDDLHQGSVRRRRLPRSGAVRADQGHHAAAR